MGGFEWLGLGVGADFGVAWFEEGLGGGGGALESPAAEEEEGFLSEGGFLPDSQRDLRWWEEEEEGLWDEPLGFLPPAIFDLWVVWGS